MAAFERVLLAHLERHRHYPRAARMRHEEGVAYLRFTMDRQGRVLGFRLDRGTGHGDLDQEALALLERAAPLPPLPAEMPQAQLELVVPLRFVLKADQ